MLVGAMVVVCMATGMQRVGVVAASLSGKENSNGNVVVRGIPGNVEKLGVVRSPQNGQLMKNHKPQGDVNIKGMARWAMNYLLRTPRPELDYQPRFYCHPLMCPPVLAGWDSIVDGDTDCRMDWEFYYMRDISGATEGRDIEKAFHQRIRNYLGDHNIAWTYIGCYDMESTEKTKAKGIIGNVWSTTKILKSLALSYERTHNPEDKALGRKVFEGLRSLATWSGKFPYLEGGMGPVGKDLKAIPTGWGIHPPPIIESLVCYWEATGDKEALDFAKAFADGIIKRVRPGDVVQINDNGTFSGHMHATLHALHGIGHLGVVTHDAHYIEFCERVYKFVMTHGTGTGWIHEAVMPTSQSKVPSGETCATSDMMSIVGSLAQADRFIPGRHYADYYDHLERYLRNYIAPAQFFITPKFVEFYRALHKTDARVEEVDKALSDLRMAEGGIMGGFGINDLTNDWLGDMRTSFALVGCCSPEGMRAIHTVWENIVRVESSGKDKKRSIYVNMSFSHQCPEATIVSYLPDEGRLTVVCRKPGDFYLRPPAWTPRAGVKMWRDAKNVSPIWNGAYAAFKNVKAGEELTITYPFISYEQKVAIWPDATKIAVFKWIGNTCVDVNPKGPNFPLYTGKRPWLPPSPKL